MQKESVKVESTTNLVLTSSPSSSVGRKNPKKAREGVEEREGATEDERERVEVAGIALDNCRFAPANGRAGSGDEAAQKFLDALHIAASTDDDDAEAEWKVDGILPPHMRPILSAAISYR